MKNLLLLFAVGFLLFGCAQKPKSPEKIAAEIHEKVLTVDTHTDTPWDLLQEGFNLNDYHDFVKTRNRVDFPRMKEGGLDAVFMASFVGQSDRNEEAYIKAFDRAMQQIDSIHAHLERSFETAELAFTPEDAYRIEKTGKRIVFIGIENGYPVGKNINNIEYFFNKGARYITLCHTRNNDICDSSTDTTEHNGLSDFGVDVVKEMNRIGMMIDVSHISDSSFYDVIKLSKTPVIASHSCARAICDNPRNLNDDMLKELAKNGGVIQMCILSDYVKAPLPNSERDSAQNAVRLKYNGFKNLTDEEEDMARKDWYAIDTIFPRKLASVADAVDHIDHMVKVAGIDHVGIGTDFDGGGGLSDCQDVSQMGNITLELVKRGYTEEEIKKIWGGNIMRVMGQVLKAVAKS
ncbi:MAG: dipeptidase [Bacteroidales bacterium]|nr:dipeptidase [Bacteroidales bacterium]MCF8402295.1 dipeptidase [Bacteroidales bacterium]